MSIYVENLIDSGDLCSELIFGNQNGNVFNRTIKYF